MVKRYNISWNWDEIDYEEDENGEWVSAIDYDDLLVRLKDAYNRIEELNNDLLEGMSK